MIPKLNKTIRKQTNKNTHTYTRVFKDRVLHLNNKKAKYFPKIGDFERDLDRNIKLKTKHLLLFFLPPRIRK